MGIYDILLVVFSGIMVFATICSIIYIFGYKYRKKSKYTGSFLGEKLDDSHNSKKVKVKFELITVLWIIVKRQKKIENFVKGTSVYKTKIISYN